MARNGGLLVPKRRLRGEREGLSPKNRIDRPVTRRTGLQIFHSELSQDPFVNNAG